VSAHGEKFERRWSTDSVPAGLFGYLAYVDGNTAGWVNASPRSAYGMYCEVDPDGPDPASVIGVSCFIIAPPYRRHGLAARLLDKVIADAADRGAHWVEGYPHNDPQGDDAGALPRAEAHLLRSRVRTCQAAGARHGNAPSCCDGLRPFFLNPSVSDGDWHAAR